MRNGSSAQFEKSYVNLFALYISMGQIELMCNGDYFYDRAVCYPLFVQIFRTLLLL